MDVKISKIIEKTTKLKKISEMARFLFSAKCLQMNAKGCNFASAKQGNTN